MPYHGVVELNGDWTNLVTAFQPNLPVGTVHVQNNHVRACEYIRADNVPGDDSKNQGVVLLGGDRRQLPVEAGIGIYFRALGRRAVAVTVES